MKMHDTGEFWQAAAERDVMMHQMTTDWDRVTTRQVKRKAMITKNICSKWKISFPIYTPISRDRQGVSLDTGQGRLES